jgi:hypothetical protein
LTVAKRHFEGDLRRLCWNGVMKALAWAALVLAGILTFGFFLVLIDLISTKIASGNIYAYSDIALALVLFCGSAYVTLRSFRRIEATNPH